MECLINGLIWSIIPGLQIIFFLKYGHAIESGGVMYYALLLPIQLAAAFHWYSYRSYDKEAKK